MKRSLHFTAVLLLGTFSLSCSFGVSPNVPTRVRQSVSARSAVSTPDTARRDHLESNENTTNSWIPTEEGNFLPNIARNRITQVTTLEEYKRHVGEEQHRMVCVRFFSQTCRACKAAEPMFRRMTLEYPSIKFVEVPLLEDNAYMLKGLGVPSFPYVHLYYPGAGLVEESRLNRKVFAEFQAVLQQYVDGYCLAEL
ncbi:hypothetical protein FisN_7Hh142 [Fistulifera solaris]|jgi:hypothetical protein|uniref:Thioredoxin domain-containing protein n=1 Tax=Fistulifera solaris TaxID=1519565 RepID=A0A1Z5K4D3_FISSO|nr:hypothetical protein FisN_7Hh142 [Fistulifera solaris]|eukprot:GAX20828.1 hypothetical protein FisN_7Hh142 [Fistulifera solaris]